MKLTTHPFKNDLLTLTREELMRIADGEEMQASALTIRLERKPDFVVYPHAASYRSETGYQQQVLVKDQLKLTFDGETGKLKSAEVFE